MPNILSLILLLPFLGALIVALIPSNFRFLIQLVALFTTGLSLLFGIFVFVSFDPGVVGYQFTQSVSWVDAIGIQYKVGVDGINVGIILMATIVAFAATCVA